MDELKNQKKTDKEKVLGQLKITDIKKNEIEVMYGAGTHVKIHSISFSITNNIIVIEAIIVLGEEINESVIDRTLIDYLIQDSIPYFLCLNIQTLLYRTKWKTH